MSNSQTEVDPRSIRIKGEFTPDPMLCHFVADRPLLEDWTLVFNAAEDGKGSPLIDELFAVEGVAKVQVAGNRVSVTKNIDTDWPLLAKHIVPAIRRAMTTEGGPISTEAVEAVQTVDPGDLAQKIERLFESHVNPALASHGGWVKLVAVKDRDVHLEMGGGCQGCSASKQTLTHGIENAIREIAPGVRNIVDVTDHDAGENPYYS